jgi:nitrogen-specific signal transduction histidine kinase
MNETVKNSSITTAVICLFLIIWSGLIIPEFEKLPNDFSLYMEYDGYDQIIETYDGELSNIFKLRESISLEVISIKENNFEISSHIHGVRLDTDEIVFNAHHTYNVDKITKLHNDKESKMFLFSPGVEKQNYDFHHPLIFSDATLIFDGEDLVKDLNVYKFSVKTEKNDISFVFPQFSPNVIWSDTETVFWVQPTTGDVVKFKRTWEDYFVVDGEKTKTMQIGGKETTQYSTDILVEATKAKIQYVNYYKIILPTFIILGIIAIATLFYLRKKLTISREELIKKEKLVMIGNLSSRIAHDIRNPLNVISMNLELMESKSKSENEKTRINRMVKATKTITYQVENVLDFVRERPIEQNKIKIGELIGGVLETITIPETITIQKQDTDITLKGDKSQLEILFTNLIINSIQAMNNVGEIKINFENHLGETIQISISDSGEGISEKNIEKIFEPLFTTKQQGTGLGLASCKTIVNSHKGTLTVTPNPTTFVVTLPKNT